MKPNKLRTATVTWIQHENYGTYLQAYALQQVLLEFGIENHIIDDKRIRCPNPLRRNILAPIKRFILRKKRLSSPYFLQFKTQYLKIDRNYSRLKELNERYDVFLCGSDQIWSANLKIEPYYYLSFTDKKKIAYAPSTGTGASTQIYRQSVKPLLERFDALSVREESGAKMLSGFIDKKITTVLDPTLLLTKATWKKLLLPITDPGNYLLCYFLTPNQWYLDYAKEYARKHQMRIRIFATHKAYHEYGGDCIYGGPQEFLSYINQAGHIFTDSYHASIFSILFEKRFVTFKRFEDGKSGDQNARIADLFRKIGLTSYFVGRNDLGTVETLPYIDYPNLQRRLSALRNESISFLKTALYN